MTLQILVVNLLHLITVFSVNVILHVIWSNLIYLKGNCLPVPLYAIEALNVKYLQLKEINSWRNAAYRKIFGFNKWDSVKELICLAGRLDVIHIASMRQINFLKRLLLRKKEVITGLMIRYLHNRELVNMRSR